MFETYRYRRVSQHLMYLLILYVLGYSIRDCHSIRSSRSFQYVLTIPVATPLQQVFV